MNVSTEMPDRLAEQLKFAGPDSSRRLLELIAVDGYRKGELSRGQVSELLDQSYNETLDMFKEHNVGPDLTLEEYREEVATLEKLLKR